VDGRRQSESSVLRSRVFVRKPMKDLFVDAKVIVTGRTNALKLHSRS
jgi:hypothetical protein